MNRREEEVGGGRRRKQKGSGGSRREQEGGGGRRKGLYVHCRREGSNFNFCPELPSNGLEALYFLNLYIITG